MPTVRDSVGAVLYTTVHSYGDRGVDAGSEPEIDGRKCRVWAAARCALAHGDAGPVREYDRAHHDACGHHPLVCALAGEGTWLAYALATVAILLVAFCVSRFARHSASPGSLHSYASMTLPPWLSAAAAWSLLLAYVATGASVIGGFYHYGNLLLRATPAHPFSAVLLAVAVTAISTWIDYRDVKISARLMLWIEGASVWLILIVVVLLLIGHGLHLDWEQLHLHRMTGNRLRLGLVMALFSFVGFESATAMGSEARDPLKIIPRAVIQSAALAGIGAANCCNSSGVCFAA